ncbi:hypothetical protein AAG570_006561 [Ranatra chinensis]|uniref:Uncharacterized protein n=1 Tax=Ranatra chinensis TaxID=642074 RepID=A0ABD0YWG6_9HEMI
MIWAIVALVGLAFVNASGPDRGCQCAAPNVRTVLFREADLERECWTQEEIALLYTRRLMEQLIPKAHPTNFTLMLDYIKSCLETVKQMVSSRRAHTLVLTAIIDTFGGYLQYEQKNVPDKYPRDIPQLNKSTLGTPGGYRGDAVPPLHE